jgi:HTH-type transcriptional regulator / antitoxin HigA
MELKAIKNEKEYNEALSNAELLFDKMPKKGTNEGNFLEVLLILIKDYEDKKYPIPLPDPIEAIKLKLEEKGMRNKDLEQYIGSKSYVSQILNKRKPLTLEIAKTLHKILGIPAEILLA